MSLATLFEEFAALETRLTAIENRLSKLLSATEEIAAALRADHHDQEHA